METDVRRMLYSIKTGSLMALATVAFLCWVGFADCVVDHLDHTDGDFLGAVDVAAVDMGDVGVGLFLASNLILLGFLVWGVLVLLKALLTRVPPRRSE